MAVMAAVITGAALDLGSAWSADLNGFMRQKGKGDVALSYTAEHYDRFWAGTTEVHVDDAGLGRIRTRSLSIWLAYGFTDRFTLVADLPYVRAESATAPFEEKDLQDLTVLGLYRFGSKGGRWRSDFIGAAGVRTRVSDYEANSPVDVGDGTTDALFRFVYQLTGPRFYVSQQIGFDRRNEDAPDGWPLYTETGWLAGPVTVSGFYSRLEARGGTDIGMSGFTFPSNQEEYRRVGAKVYGRVGKGIGLSAMYFTTLGGRNTGDTRGLSGGVKVSL
jgi:hypothetical protein